MVQVIKDVVTWLKQWFYTESEVDTIVGGLQSQINNKADTATLNSLTNTINDKAPKNHASTSTDYGVGSEKNYGHVKVDNTLSASSTNTVQNKIVKNALDNKASSVHNHDITDIKDSSGKSLDALLVGKADMSELNNYETTNHASSTYATKTELSNALSELNIDIVEIVTILPTASADTINKLYAVIKQEQSPNDIADVYITVKTGDTYSWEQIDFMNMDLSDYIKKTNGTGLLRQNGTVDNTIYTSHEEFENYIPKGNSVYIESPVSQVKYSNILFSPGEGINPGMLNANDMLSKGFIYLDYTLGKKTDDSQSIDLNNIVLVDKGQTDEGCIIFNTIK